MKNLLDDISMDALQGMRESGMSNRDIANSLGVSYATIYKYLGAQPAPHGGKVQSYCPPSCPQPIQSDAGKDDEPEEASLVVEDNRDEYENGHSIDADYGAAVHRHG